MKTTGLLLAAGLLAVAAAGNAAPLTPEQALNSARGCNSASGQLRAKGAEMNLLYTLNGVQGPTLYIFGPATTDSKGFIVAAADDLVTPLLGYSEDGVFDVANMPEQMRWWLDCCNAAVEYIRTGEGAECGLLRGASKESRSPIAPMIATKWNQSAPFNGSTPLIDSKRTVTGCVATAIAQLMYFHKYPLKGDGSHNYSYTTGGVAYTDEFDFSATTFDWDNMLEDYSGGYTDTQAAAVATLMHACGNAASMTYGLTGSSTRVNFGADGMIKYLGYDSGMTTQRREWYTAEDWDNLVYGELDAGRPIIYGGYNDDGSGHIFICDGYSADGYYHINWGWGGKSDGYFLLPDLNPYDQGIGGGDIGKGFNFTQTATIGIKPADGTVTNRPVLFGYSNLYPENESYNVGSEIRLYSDGWFKNYSTSDYQSTVMYGVRLESGSQTQYVKWASGVGTSISRYGGYERIRLKSSSLPTGEWKAYPVVSVDGGNTWTEMRYDPTQTDGYVNMKVTSSKVTITPSNSETISLGYIRPQGCYYVPFITEDGVKGYTSNVVPDIALDPYSTVVFKNVSTGVHAYNWSCQSEDWTTAEFSEQTSRASDFEYKVGTEPAEVPILTGTTNGATKTFQFTGYDLETGDKTALRVFGKPNHPDHISADVNLHAWSSPKYFGKNTNRDNTKTTGIYFFENSTSGYMFGKNSYPAGYNGMGVAFEAPLRPYMVRSLGMMFDRLSLTSASSKPKFTMSVYALDEIPAYNESTNVEIVPDRLLVSKELELSTNWLEENFTKASNGYKGIMRFELDEPLLVDGAVLVTLTGYNCDEVSSFTTVCSTDYFDDGYGELGYIRDGNGDWKGMTNLTSGLNGRKSAPALLMEIERPMIMWKDLNSTRSHTFSQIGEVAEFYLKVSRGADHITVASPDWIRVFVNDVTDEEGKFLNEVNVRIMAIVPESNSQANSAIRYGVSDSNSKVELTLDGIRKVEYEVIREAGVLTSIDGIKDGVIVKSIKYVNMEGETSDKPFSGVNLKITTFGDNSRKIEKTVQ